MSNSNSISFTNEYTKSIKGVAILLMMVIHVAISPEKQPNGLHLIPFLKDGFLNTLGSYGIISLPIFMFLGGYGFYCQLCSFNGDGWRCLCKRIAQLYKMYWRVFFVFIPIAFIFFSHQEIYAEASDICTRYQKFSLQTFLGNLIGWQCSYNSEWWFFKTYIFSLVEGLLFFHLIQHKNFLFDFCSIIIISILLESVFPSLIPKSSFSAITSNELFNNFFLIGKYTSCFFSGMIFSKNNLFGAFCDTIKLTREKTSCCVGVFAAIISFFVGYIWTTVINQNFDIFICPVFIFSIFIVFSCFKPLQTLFSFIGKYSGYMWLIHSFFCYYFGTFSRFVFASRNFFVSYFTLVIISLLSSVLLAKFWSLIESLYCRTQLKKEV